MRSSTWHAHGNVYLLTSPLPEVTPESIRELVGDRDGIVEVLAHTHDEVRVRIWNPDGSTAEMSGNGTRIAARWLADETGATTVRVRVGERDVVSRVLDDGQIEQAFGEVSVGDRDRVDGIEFTPVSVGNPHAVVVGDPDDIVWIGPMLEKHPRFPRRTNVQVARIEKGGEVTARVWERGVGETSASGTSAVAVAAATHSDGQVVVHFPGGDLRVRLEPGRAWLTGPAVRID